MRTKWIVLPISAVLCIAGIVLAGYYYMVEYTISRFAPNIWINGIYCTGKTVDEVNRELLKDLVVPTITVRDNKGVSYDIELSAIDYVYDYRDFLNHCQSVYSGKTWLGSLFDKRDLIAPLPEINYDVEKLKTIWNQLAIVEAENVSPIVHLYYDGNGYQLENTLSDHLAVQKGWEALLSALEQRRDSLSLVDANCYFDYEMDENQKATYLLWENLTELEQCGLTYDFGAEQVIFDKSLMSRFISKDSLGNPLYDQEGNLFYDKEIITTYITELCESYHTYGVKRNFQSSRGDIIQVKGVTYGTQLNTQKEVDFLLDYLLDDEKRTVQLIHTPEYIIDTPFHGLDDIGGTYVEVDMTQQKLYFYLDYELQFSTDIVTGNLRTKHGTPEGVNYIYKKQTKRVLRGPGYASFVKYWMPFYQAIGLHDASWRDQFGGDIYKTNGSHGCINIPEEYVAQIYEKCEIGTPVITFY